MASSENNTQKSHTHYLADNLAWNVIRALNTDSAPWQQPLLEGNGTQPFNPITGTRYSGNNRLRLAFAENSDPRWITAYQAKKEGLEIAPGSKGTVVAWSEWDKQEGAEKAIKRSTGTHVFNAEQIYGMPDLNIDSLNIEARQDKKAEITALPEFQDGGIRAVISCVMDKDHLDMGGNPPTGTKAHAAKHLRAEIAAWMLAEELGLAHEPVSMSTTYKEACITMLKEDSFEILRAASDAEKAKEYILEQGLEQVREAPSRENPQVPVDTPQIPLSEEQKKELQVQQEQKIAMQQEEFAQLQEQAAEHAQKFFAERAPAPSDHAFLKGKQIVPDGLKISPTGTEVIVPMTNINGEIRNIQSIAEDGKARYLPHGQRQNTLSMLGAELQKKEDLTNSDILLSNGIASGSSLHQATGKPVAIAFYDGNLKDVAISLRERFPKAKITVCADIGSEKAKEAAQAVGGKIVTPELNDKEKAQGMTSFNDLHLSRGLSVLQKQLGKERNQSKGMSR